MDLDRAVRRNTVLLAGAMAVNSATLQLVAAVSSLTFVLVTGVERLLGLGPAIFLTSGALTSAFAGRAMDRYGRVPILALGFVAAATGAALTGLGAATSSAVAVIAGFACIGVGASTANLTRAAGGDM
jgi:MFS family permease